MGAVGVSERKEFRDLVPPERAREVIAGLELGGGTERVPLDAARGRVLARRVDADIDVPGFGRATVDGYALRARDTFGADEADPARLGVVGDVHTGEKPGVTVESGTAASVSTGAVMPPGADAVVKVERTTREDGEVAVRTAVAPGDGVMAAGADVAAGERALGPGIRVTPREVGLLSALGVDEVPVRERPRVGILSTGDELVRPGDPLEHSRGEIHDVNSYTIAASVEEAGGEPVLYPHAGDDYGEMERLLREAATECDLVLTSGSTSASAVDVVYRVVEECGELLLHGVAVKPGKPMLVGTIEGAAYVGLPGYPVSALTIFRTFVAPAIREAAGLEEPPTERVSGEMAVRERYAEGRLRLMPAGLVERGDGGTLVYPVDKGSGATTSLVEADGIVEVPADTDYLGEGQPVEVQLFSPEVRPPSVLAVGEDDPAFSRFLDAIDRPRFLPVGSGEGLRRLRDGVPDVAVVAGPTERDVESVELGAWSREWGLVVPPENPAGVEGLADLVDREVRFVNRNRESGLRASLEAAVSELADDRGTTAAGVTDTIDGFELTRRAHESPARMVEDGEADAGLGLRASSEALGLGFVPLGTQRVRALANPDRAGKAGIRDLETAIADGTVLDTLAGFEQ
ncbi:MAG: molybdopterin biosynthesis protein [Halobacteriales archaeon SW_9_67_25]|nr:MAG: molybdopterin biosynthesis protein [Halobacteriales archaeon SW_9_67_25]